MDLVDIITEIGKPRFGSLKITPIRLDIDFRLILGLENDWAALDSPLCYLLLAVDMRRTTRFVTIQRRIVARVHFC
jgi:hypothetical protein